MENFIASELIKKELTPNFWRTKSGAEVDFIVQKNGEIIPIEVKSGIAKTPGKSLISFIKKYKPSKAYVFHTGGISSSTLHNTKIFFRPLYAIPLVIS